ncbi:metal ABC transporter solute-binding protein, Zn/Mn family [Lapidilactobacillus mulanensis]|uniref:Metal ABC transporter solute-binding protein, Zn/Mn family n=1 Tax=Lapidilactobacillus mulanensis TaxID=2485999 RepID=A0ABW4DLC3_9LACO|nr:zinc ABC transporter substrate-binding protein [Lapidilactobacillus mulanensis]
MHRKIIAGLLLVFGITILTACGTNAKPAQTQSPTGKIKVVSSLDFYAEIAEHILGDQGQVTSIINSSGVDPHDYTPTTNDAKAVAKSDVAVMNGAGYDAWLEKLVDSSDHSTKLIDVAADVRHLPDGENEHLWYDFATMIKVNRYLVKQFSELRPQERTTFQKNGEKFLAQLKQLQQQETQLKEQFAGDKVMVTEPVFNDVLVKLDMKIVNPDFAQDIEEGADPKPADLQKMKDQLKNRQVAFLVVNKQVESSLITELTAAAKKSGVPIVTVTETMPENQTYIKWMKSQLEQLANIATKE